MLGVPIVKTRKYLTNEGFPVSEDVRTHAHGKDAIGEGAGLIKLVENNDGNVVGSIGYNTGVFLGSRNECIIE